jgi:hypothetical protein
MAITSQYFGQEARENTTFFDFANNSVDKLTSTWRDHVSTKNKSQENIANIETKNQLTSNQKVLIVVAVLVTVIITIVLLRKK